MIVRNFIIILSLIILVSCGTNTTHFDAQYYLVRHAEKTTEKFDPDLTELGIQRAMDLADRLEDVALTHVYSSDFRRTVNTAKPVSENKNLEIILYDQKNLEGLSKARLIMVSLILQIISDATNALDLNEKYS